MKKLLLWDSCFVFEFSFCFGGPVQELDTTAVDTVEIEPPPYYLGVYLEGGMSFEAQ